MKGAEVLEVPGRFEAHGLALAGAIVPVSRTLESVAVAVWLVESSLLNLTVVPLATVRLASVKAYSLIVTALGARAGGRGPNCRRCCRRR